MSGYKGCVLLFYRHLKSTAHDVMLAHVCVHVHRQQIAGCMGGIFLEDSIRGVKSGFPTIEGGYTAMMM